MTFRSPPPHRKSSGSSGGKSEFQQAQLDLQALVRKVGFDKLPLNDDTLRPFLLLLYDFAERHQTKVWSFDHASGPQAGRIFHGLMGQLVPLKTLQTKLTNEMMEKFPRKEIARAKPVFMITPALLYYENIWTPAAALQSRRQ